MIYVNKCSMIDELGQSPIVITIFLLVNN